MFKQQEARLLEVPVVGQKALLLQIKTAPVSRGEVAVLQAQCQEHAAKIHAALHILDVEGAAELLTPLTLAMEDLRRLVRPENEGSVSCGNSL